ncbi:sulfate/molybdate ABC transporter ATP-binding protein [Pedobacter aquatilis]|uniref:sulfate/molybdate ABC transporter ATP-binding protein n=1 Tax=Pedobacter aquatilis TaxID=351343 RepID=UPI002930DFBD|nr:ATP-binding cassette domain-containing protein [Pedobacter aquatilis]
MIKVQIKKKIGGKYGTLNLDVDTKFHLNTLTHIVGPSGIGKTTFLKIMAGLIQPDSGNISFDTDPWYDGQTAFSKKVQLRSVGFVFQDYALFPNMTVEKHLRFGTDDTDYINELLEMGELSLLAKRYPKQLSGGQQQRLAILRALSTRPKLLLLDEPFSALDSELKSRLISKLIPLLERLQITVLLVSHQENELKYYPSESYILNGIEE